MSKISEDLKKHADHYANLHPTLASILKRAQNHIAEQGQEIAALRKQLNTATKEIAELRQDKKDQSVALRNVFRELESVTEQYAERDGETEFLVERCRLLAKERDERDRRFDLIQQWMLNSFVEYIGEDRAYWYEFTDEHKEAAEWLEEATE